MTEIWGFLVEKKTFSIFFIFSPCERKTPYISRFSSSTLRLGGTKKHPKAKIQLWVLRPSPPGNYQDPRSSQVRKVSVGQVKSKIFLDTKLFLEQTFFFEIKILSNIVLMKDIAYEFCDNPEEWFFLTIFRIAFSFNVMHSLYVENYIMLAFTDKSIHKMSL